MWYTNNSLRNNLYKDYSVSYDDNGLNISLDAPGLKPDEIKISLQDGLLKVFGENETRSLRRTYSLLFAPKDIEAKLDLGVLSLRLTKPDILKPKQIPINSS